MTRMIASCACFPVTLVACVALASAQSPKTAPKTPEQASKPSAAKPAPAPQGGTNAPLQPPPRPGEKKAEAATGANTAENKQALKADAAPPNTPVLIVTDPPVRVAPCLPADEPSVCPRVVIKIGEVASITVGGGQAEAYYWELPPELSSKSGNPQTIYVSGGRPGEYRVRAVRFRAARNGGPPERVDPPGEVIVVVDAAPWVAKPAGACATAAEEVTHARHQYPDLVAEVSKLSQAHDPAVRAALASLYVEAANYLRDRKNVTPADIENFWKAKFGAPAVQALPAVQTLAGEIWKLQDKYLRTVPLGPGSIEGTRAINLAAAAALGYTCR